MTTAMEKTTPSHAAKSKPHLCSSQPVPLPDDQSPSSHTSSLLPMTSHSPSSLSPSTTPTPSLAPVTPPSTCAPMTTESEARPSRVTDYDDRTTTEQRDAPTVQNQCVSVVANSGAPTQGRINSIDPTQETSVAQLQPQQATNGMPGSRPVIKQEVNLSVHSHSHHHHQQQQQKQQRQQQQQHTNGPNFDEQTPHAPHATSPLHHDQTSDAVQADRQQALIKQQPQLIPHSHSPSSSSKGPSNSNSNCNSTSTPSPSVSTAVPAPVPSCTLPSDVAPEETTAYEKMRSSTFIIMPDDQGEGEQAQQRHRSLQHPPDMSQLQIQVSQGPSTPGTSSSSSLVNSSGGAVEENRMISTTATTSTTNTVPKTPTTTPNATPASTPRKARSKGGRRAANPHLTEEQRKRERVLKNRESAMKSLQKKKRYTQNLEHHAIALAKRNAELRDKIGVLLVRLNHLHGLPPQQLGMESLNLGGTTTTTGGISSTQLGSTTASGLTGQGLQQHVNNSNEMPFKDSSSRFQCSMGLDAGSMAGQGWRNTSMGQGGGGGGGLNITHPHLNPHSHSHLNLNAHNSQHHQQMLHAHHQQSAAPQQPSPMLLDTTTELKGMNAGGQQPHTANTSSHSLPNVVITPESSCPPVLDSPI